MKFEPAVHDTWEYVRFANVDTAPQTDIIFVGSHKEAATQPAG